MNNIWAFVVYSILYEAIIWGIFGWAVFFNGHSGWWILVAMLMSSSQLQPRNFGINPVDDLESERNNNE